MWKDCVKARTQALGEVGRAEGATYTRAELELRGVPGERYSIVFFYFVNIEVQI